MKKDYMVNIMLEFERTAGEYKCGVQFMKNLLDKMIEEGYEYGGKSLQTKLDLSQKLATENQKRYSTALEEIKALTLALETIKHHPESLDASAIYLKSVAIEALGDL